MKAPTVAAVLLILFAASAAAQQTTPPASKLATQPPTRTIQPPVQDARGPWYASAFMGSAVYGLSGERIGDLKDFAFDETGKITAVIVGVGGFLGIGEKEVSVPVGQAKRMVHSDGKTYFTVNATREQLQAAPEYKR